MAKAMDLAKCVSLSGDPSAGILLFMFLFRVRVYTVKVDGVSYLPRTYENLATDTGLPMRTTARAIARLKDRHLIETRVRKYAGLKTLHIAASTRLKSAFPDEFIDHVSEEVTCHNGSTAIVPHWHDSHSATLASSIEIEKGEKEEKNFQKEILENAHEQETDSTGTSQMKTEEILTNPLARKPKPVPVTESAKREHLWRTLCSEASGKGSAKLTFKQQSCLKNIATKAGDDFEKLLRATVLHWPDFVEAIMTAKPYMKEVATTPDLGCLLYHADTGLLMIPDSKPATPALVKTTPVVSSTTAPTGPVGSKGNLPPKKPSQGLEDAPKLVSVEVAVAMMESVFGGGLTPEFEGVTLTKSNEGP